MAPALMSRGRYSVAITGAVHVLGCEIAQGRGLQVEAERVNSLAVGRGLSAPGCSHVDSLVLTSKCAVTAVHLGGPAYATAWYSNPGGRRHVGGLDVESVWPNPEPHRGSSHYRILAADQQGRSGADVYTRND